MDNLRNILKERRNLVAILVLAVLVVAIPLTIYLVRQQQILRSKAFGSPPIEFFGTGVTSGNPPTTTSQNVQLKLTYGLVSTPSPTPTPTPTPPITSTPTPTPVPPVSGSPASYRLSTDPSFSTILAQGNYSPNVISDNINLSSLTGNSGGVSTIYAQFLVNGQWMPNSSTSLPSTVKAQIRIGTAGKPTAHYTDGRFPINASIQATVGQPINFSATGQAPAGKTLSELGIYIATNSQFTLDRPIVRKTDCNGSTCTVYCNGSTCTVSGTWTPTAADVSAVYGLYYLVFLQAKDSSGQTCLMSYPTTSCPPGGVCTTSSFPICDSSGDVFRFVRFSSAIGQPTPPPDTYPTPANGSECFLIPPPYTIMTSIEPCPTGPGWRFIQ